MLEFEYNKKDDLTLGYETVFYLVGVQMVLYVTMQMESCNRK